MAWMVSDILLNIILNTLVTNFQGGILKDKFNEDDSPNYSWKEKEEFFSYEHNFVLKHSWSKLIFYTFAFMGSHQS